MKRIFLACFLLTATCSVTFVQQAVAHAPVPADVTVAAFNAKVNLMDSQLGSGDVASAQTTWNEVHQMMITILGTTKHSIASAATPADKASYTAIYNNQYSLYKDIWALKPDLATNRTAIHTKLLAYAVTIY